jgi:hypothetical protein
MYLILMSINIKYTNADFTRIIVLSRVNDFVTSQFSKEVQMFLHNFYATFVHFNLYQIPHNIFIASFLPSPCPPTLTPTPSKLLSPSLLVITTSPI